MILRQFRLQPAPADTVAGDDDLALDADAQPLQRLVIVRHAVIDVDEVGRHIAVALIGDIGRQRAGGPGGGGVALDRRFLQRRLERFRSDQLQRLADRRRIQHLERFDARVPAPAFELRHLEIGIFLVVRRAHLVRLRRHPLHPIAQLVRMDRRVEAFLQRRLIRRRRAVGRHGGKQSESRDGDNAIHWTGTPPNDHYLPTSGATTISILVDAHMLPALIVTTQARPSWRLMNCSTTRSAISELNASQPSAGSFRA